MHGRRESEIVNLSLRGVPIARFAPLNERAIIKQEPVIFVFVSKRYSARTERKNCVNGLSNDLPSRVLVGERESVFPNLDVFSKLVCDGTPDDSWVAKHDLGIGLVHSEPNVLKAGCWLVGAPYNEKSYEQDFFHGKPPLIVNC